MPPIEFEKREFVRVRAAVQVRYRYLAKESTDAAIDEIYEGTSNNLGGGGLLLAGRVPNPEWISDLLTHRILVGVNVFLTDDEYVKALTKVSWVETVDPSLGTCNIGLKFQDISTSDKDRLFRYIIKTQIS